MYEEALELEASIDAMVGDEDRNKGGSSGGKLGSKTPAKGHEFVTPAAPGGQNEEEESDGRALGKEVQEGAEPEVPRRVSDARRVKALFETCIYPKWKELVQTKRIMVAEVEVRKDNVHSARAGLERFDCGTRCLLLHSDTALTRHQDSFTHA
jgi:hypothetical protein